MTEFSELVISPPFEAAIKLLQVVLNLKLPEDVKPVPVPKPTSSVLIATDPPPLIVETSRYLT